MLKKRIIPCLDIKDGRTVKGVNFVGLRDAGDPVDLAERYAQEGADELVFLDITATHEERKTLFQLVERVADRVNIPFTVGGGIADPADVEAILQSGADKVSINSAAVRNPALISNLAERFGNQCVVLAVDARLIDDKWIVYVKGGRESTGKELLGWVAEAEERGAGEVLFTSMDHDGTKQGFANDALRMLKENTGLPVIASGGAGKVDHFTEVFKWGKADAALAASVFHFGQISIPSLKQMLHNQRIPVRI